MHSYAVWLKGWCLVRMLYLPNVMHANNGGRPPDKQKCCGKIVNIFLSITLSKCFGFVFCLFLLLYVPCQQLWSLRDGQYT